MPITTISSLSQTSLLTQQLQAQNVTLSNLATQLSTGKEYSNLTDYAPSDALSLINLQNSATQKSAYITVINTVQTRMSAYDNTMTDMESIISQAQNLVASGGSYSTGNASTASTLSVNFLKSVGIDLNQEVNGRYIYAGSRYATAPVGDLTTLGAPTGTIYTDGQTLPAYDVGATTSTLTTSTSGQTVTIGGTAGATQSASVLVNGKTYTYDATSTDTPTTVAAGLAALVDVDIPGTTSSGVNLTVGGTGTITSASTGTTSASAYSTDSATIDSGYTLQIGVTSNNPAFQQLIQGLQYIQSAGATTDAATYASDMSKASTLLGSALTSMQSVHATVANNIDVLTAEKTAQTAAISSLTNQVDDIQQVDVTQVSAEITALEAQLQASYSVTGTLEKMSIVSYL